MKLEVECTWNNKRSKAKQEIRFDYLPKHIFCMPDEKIQLLQQISQKAGEEGPSTLNQLQALKMQFPQSLYASFIYYQVLSFFQYEEEADLLLEELQNHFSEELLTKCILANELIKKKEYDAFTDLFENVEVLKGAFPKRKVFFFEEALFFHNLWAYYFDQKGDEIQSQKHKKFIFLIINTFQTFRLTQQPAD